MARPRDRNASTTTTVRLPYPGRAAGRRNGQGVEEAVYEATEHLLASMPIADVSVAQILDRAGVSRTTFYHYFTSKHAVIAAMLDDVQRELIGVMRPWFGRGERDPESALRDAIGAVADVWARHRSTMRASSENWHSVEEIANRWVAMLDRFTADISTQIDKERAADLAPRGTDSRVLAQTLVWSSERMLYLGGFGLCGPNMERGAIDGIIALWLGSIYQTAPQA